MPSVERRGPGPHRRVVQALVACLLAATAVAVVGGSAAADLPELEPEAGEVRERAREIVEGLTGESGSDLPLPEQAGDPVFPGDPGAPGEFEGDPFGPGGSGPADPGEPAEPPDLPEAPDAPELNLDIDPPPLDWLATLLQALVYVVVGVLVVVVVWAIVRAVAAFLARRAERATADDEDDLQEDDDDDDDDDDTEDEPDDAALRRPDEPLLTDIPGWLQLAEMAEADGRWRDAIRCRWRALVAEMAAEGSLADLAGSTVGEQRVQVGTTRPEAYPSFVAAATLFEEAWYGRHPVDVGEATALRQHAEDCAQAARRQPVGAGQ